MNERRRRLEREIQRAEQNERATRRMLAELNEETAELNALLASAGMEPVASFPVAEPTRTHRAAASRVPMLRA